MLITITRDGGATLEQLDDALLEKCEGVVDNDRERSTWVEYWLDGQLVHRSAHVTIKQGPRGSDGVLGTLNNGIDVDGWAQIYVANLLQRRKRAGRPIEVRDRFTPEQAQAIQRVMARHEGMQLLVTHSNGANDGTSATA
jgi:hypothetical protein